MHYCYNHNQLKHNQWFFILWNRNNHLYQTPPHLKNLYKGNHSFHNSYLSGFLLRHLNEKINSGNNNFSPQVQW